MTTKKIICVWIGTYNSEKEFYQEYLKFDYENEDEPTSQFGKDVELEYYDEDYIESWWFKKLEINNIIQNQDVLPDSQYFFEELISELKKKDLNTFTFITFLFGEIGTYETNEMLFEYSGMRSTEKPVEFIFKKEYELL
ncbi:immunity 22 family protein [Flavobacterium sp. NRK F10]|uniref:immunity 22 family protein n=1 Tax=Flavobacterium sp. NRK F10 TaxID=2954931 RepID=UPI002090DD73|nr:immunity 22 family protein [Flavobacterium sp. NRK F10]MCO6173950.1 immunity 22 family protein [Flavobacterium sp. NRK F10]